MVEIPEIVTVAFRDRNGPPALTTVDANGVPNTIWISLIVQLDASAFAIADIAFYKTLANIRTGGPATLLVLAESGGYQMKGKIDYHTEGPIFEGAGAWVDQDEVVNGVAVFRVEAVYKGAIKLA